VRDLVQEQCGMRKLSDLKEKKNVLWDQLMQKKLNYLHKFFNDNSK